MHACNIASKQGGVTTGSDKGSDTDPFLDKDEDQVEENWPTALSALTKKLPGAPG